MDITNNYGRAYADADMVTNGKEEKRVCSLRTVASENSTDNVKEYYRNLCRKFPGISFSTGSGMKSSSENKIVLNLSGDCLKKMAADPKFAKKMEDTISGIPAAHKWVYARAKSDGIEMHGFSVRINPDGSMQCSCSGSTKKGDGEKSKGAAGRAEEKRKERVEERRNEKAESIEKAAEKREEKKDRERIVQSILEDFLETAVSNMPGFDMKA